MTTPTRCPSTAELRVDDRPTGAIMRCELDAGHDMPRYADPQPLYAGLHQPYEVEPGTPHRCSLEWTDDEDIAASWPEAHDADEAFDLEVDIAPAEARDAQVDATRD